MEENKVREKFQKALGDGLLHASQNHGIDVVKLTDFLLQSPDLRVTLVEPRYRAGLTAVGYGVWDKKTLVAEFDNGAGRAQMANEYAHWLNSKEPK